MPPGRGEIIEERSQGWRSAGSGGEGDEKSEGERAEKVDLEDWNLTQDGGGEHVRMSLTTGMQKDGLRRRNRNLVARTDDGNESMPISISGTQTFNVVIETSFITVSAGASAEADIPVLTPVGAGYTSATGTQQVLPSISTPPVSPSDIPSALPFSPSPLVSHSAPTSQTTALAVATSQAVIAPTATSELASGNAPSTSKSISKTITSYLTPSSSSTGRPRNTTITSITSSTTTQWIYTTATVSDIVVVYASPAPAANSDGTISSTKSPATTTRSEVFIPMSTSTTGASDNGVIGGGVGIVSGTGSTTSGNTSPSNSSGSDSGGGSSNDSNLTPKLVGGLLGGLAVTAMVLWLILFLIRRHKRHLVVQQRVDAGYGGPAPAMAQASSPITAAASFLGSFGRNSRQSAASEPVSEERGFYKVSGRKLAPAIGGPRPGTILPHGSSVFQDDDGRWPGGPKTPPPVSSPLSSRPSRFSGATQDTTSSGIGASIVPMGTALGTPHTAGPTSPETSSINPFDDSQYPPYPPYGRVPGYSASGPSTPTLSARIPEETGETHFQAELDRERANTPRLSAQHSRDFAARSSSRATDRDGVGRSLPSHDGSRTSRFTEDIV